MKKLKAKIFNWLSVYVERYGNEKHSPKVVGESKSVTVGITGLVDSFVQVTAWSNGEGYDIRFETKAGSDWKETSFKLHTDELECLLTALNEFEYFEIFKDEQ